MTSAIRSALWAAMGAGACALAQAQAQLPSSPQVPDAGRLLQEQGGRAPVAPAAPRPLGIEPPATGAAPALPGGAQVSVTAVRLEGLSGAAASSLSQPLADELTRQAAGRRLDLSGLRALADTALERVRAAGYPFARAYLPPQDLAGGVLRIAVVEGRYGTVQATGDLATQAQPWLAPLRPGEPIAAVPLERSLLLLGDLPGVQTQSVLRPGEQPGTGDLNVAVQGGRRVQGELGVDNHGNRYAGRERVRAGVDVDSLLAFGDQLGLRASFSREGTWLGSVAYAAPLGTSGLRASLAASRTDYQLGREFESLDAQGTADVLSAQLAYPLLRGQNANLRLSGGASHKRLHDQRGATGLDERKRANTLTLAASGDLRDGAGVSWGQLALTLGRLQLDGALQAADRASARTQGRYTKVNLDAARLHRLGGGWSAYARGSAQWASKNLDSSEKMVLGGVYGVRAWPSGEASGDAGALAQLELRYAVAGWSPFVFADAGRVRINREPFAGAASNRRSISGAGVGLRWSQGPFQAEATLGWRTGGSSQSTTEPMASQPQGWLSAAWRF